MLTWCERPLPCGGVEQLHLWLHYDHRRVTEITVQGCQGFTRYLMVCLNIMYAGAFDVMLRPRHADPRPRRLRARQYPYPGTTC